MKKQSKKRFELLVSLSCGFGNYQLTKGVDYDTEFVKKEDDLISWIIKQCPNIDDYKLRELIDELLDKKENSIFNLLSDLDVLKIDFDKLPPIKDIEFGD